MRACLRLYRRLPYVSAIAVCFIGLYCTAAYITNLFAFKMCAGGSMADGALFFFFCMMMLSKYMLPLQWDRWLCGCQGFSLDWFPSLQTCLTFAAESSSHNECYCYVNWKCFGTIIASGVGCGGTKVFFPNGEFVWWLSSFPTVRWHGPR